MVAVAEFPLVRTVAIQRLIADSGIGGVNTLVGGRIYRGQALKNTAFPYVGVWDYTAENFLTANAFHVQQDVQLIVKCTDRSKSDDRINEIGNRVIERLDQYGDVVFEGIYVVMFRYVSSQVQPDETDGDQRYTYLNHVFKTEAYPWS